MKTSLIVATSYLLMLTACAMYVIPTILGSARKEGFKPGMGGPFLVEISFCSNNVLDLDLYSLQLHYIIIIIIL